MRNDVRLLIGGFQIDTWDAVTIESSIDTPADGWSFSLFDQEGLQLPESVKGGAKVELYYGKELILRSVADKVTEAVDRNGYGLQITGRDLAGQLIDCSVPIFNGRQMSLDELLKSVAQDTKVNVQNNSWLKNKVSVEPGESVLDAITKAAAVTGQAVWFDAEGTLNIGDPFANPYQVQTPLKLMRYADDNNVLSLKYDEDVSNVYTHFKVLSQDSNAKNILSETSVDTQYTHKRLKILTLSDIETKAEADAALKKIEKDNNLQAYSLVVQREGWTIDDKIWRQGFYVDVQTNRLIRATAKWMVTAYKLTLDRQNGLMSEIVLNRQGDWAQPLVHKEPVKKAKPAKKSKTATKKDTAKDQTEGKQNESKRK